MSVVALDADAVLEAPCKGGPVVRPSSGKGTPLSVHADPQLPVISRGGVYGFGLHVEFLEYVSAPCKFDAA